MVTAERKTFFDFKSFSILFFWDCTSQWNLLKIQVSKFSRLCILCAVLKTPVIFVLSSEPSNAGAVTAKNPSNTGTTSGIFRLPSSTNPTGDISSSDIYYYRINYDIDSISDNLTVVDFVLVLLK